MAANHNYFSTTMSKFIDTLSCIDVKPEMEPYAAIMANFIDALFCIDARQEVEPALWIKYSYNPIFKCSTRTGDPKTVPSLRELTMSKVHDQLANKFIEQNYDIWSLKENNEKTPIPEFTELKQLIPASLVEEIKNDYFSCFQHSKLATKTAYATGMCRDKYLCPHPYPYSRSTPDCCYYDPYTYGVVHYIPNRR